MCKLCNTDRKSYVPTRNNLKQESVEFIYIAKEYIGEFPCHACMANYLKMQSRGIHDSVDSCVIKVLLKNYSKGLSAVSISRSNARYYAKLNPQSRTLEHIEENIRKVTNNHTGTTSYKVEKKISGKLYSKQFHSIDKAREYRTILNNGKELKCLRK